MTKGYNATLDAMVVDNLDPNGWGWSTWNTYWKDYINSDSPIGGLTSKNKPVQGDEDFICDVGYFSNE